jgi:hypothetical protein
LRHGKGVPEFSLKDKEFHGQDMDNNKEASQLPER